MLLTMESDVAFDLSPNMSPERRMFREEGELRHSIHSQSLKRLKVGLHKGRTVDNSITLLQHRSAALLIRSRMPNLVGKLRVLRGNKRSYDPSRAPSVLDIDSSDLPKARKSVLERSVLENRSQQIERYSKLIRPTIRLKKKSDGEPESLVQLPKLTRGYHMVGHAISPRQIIAQRKGKAL